MAPGLADVLRISMASDRHARLIIRHIITTLILIALLIILIMIIILIILNQGRQIRLRRAAPLRTAPLPRRSRAAAAILSWRVALWRISRVRYSPHGRTPCTHARLYGRMHTCITGTDYCKCMVERKRERERVCVVQGGETGREDREGEVLPAHDIESLM